MVGVADQPIDVDTFPPPVAMEMTLPFLMEDECNTENIMVMKPYEQTPKRKKLSVVDKYETDETRPLNNSELQRLVLLQQLTVLKLQEKTFKLQLGE